MIRLAACLLAIAAGAHAAEYPYLAPSSDAGRLRCEVPPGWERAEFDERDFLAPPPPPPSSPDGGAPPDGGVPCEATRIRRRFDVGPEAARLASLTLHARYQDGLVAYLNGVEIARRRLVEGAPLATEPHGPEPERFLVPLRPGLLRATGNVLAVEARPWRAGRSSGLEVALDGADAVRVVRGPYLQKMLDGEAWIALETDLPSRVSVRYGPGAPGSEVAPEDEAQPTKLREAHDDRPATRHLLRLERLKEATSYRYQLSVRADGADPFELEAGFHTPPSPSHPLRFVVLGDVRSGHDVHAELVRAVAAEDPDLVLMTGDLVDRGTDEGDWDRFFEIAAPLLRQVAIYPAVGNHEYVRKGRGLQRFLSLFLRNQPTAWWSFDVAGVHFVCLDSEAFQNPEQRAWLERDLAEARRKKTRAIFAFDHDGPWSSQLHGDNQLAVHEIAPLLERYKVALVFGGHDHDYERGRVGQLDYVVTGGGGAELRLPRCGVEGRPKCGPRVRAFANEHHYVLVEVLRDKVRLCPKRADGTLLEECPTIPFRK